MIAFIEIPHEMDIVFMKQILLSRDPSPIRVTQNITQEIRSKEIRVNTLGI